MLKYRRLFLASAIAFAMLPFCWGAGASKIGQHYWPTPNPAFMEHGEMQGVLQPTVSGVLTSGLFGCVRNSGHRFHEGVDLKVLSSDSRNEPIDPVYAFDKGIVRYVNRMAGASQYGRYIVIEHPHIAAGLVTLYAHLRVVPPNIDAGVSVEGGQEIATMGRSAGGYTIPRSRAHLHFELGFWLGPKFQTWYDQQPYGSDNEHLSYNGINIIGIDVWQMFHSLRRGEVSNVWEFIQSEPIAVQAFVRSNQIPELLAVNPNLMENVALPEGHIGWRIQFTWYGLPISFRALVEEEFASERYIAVETLRPDLIEGKLCMEMVRGDVFAGAGKKLKSVIGRMFLR